MSKRCHSPDRSGTPSKRVKYVSSFKDEWRSTYSWVKRSVKGDGYAFCVVCNVNISVSHGGKNDLTKQQKTVTHTASAEAAKSTPKVTSLLASGPDKVTTAETLFCHFTVEHNLPMAVADHFSSLVKQMFPDSEIAKNFACMRSKTTHIINKALAPTADDRVTSLCKTEKFSLMVDESNDHRDDKCVTILVRVLDRTVHRIATRFLDLPVCNIGTGANIFDTINEVLVGRDIPWSNCIGYGSDNASVMIGRNNSVLSRIREVQPQVFDLGCVCHLANIVCQAGVKKIPLPVEDLLVETYYHFNQSSKRREEYREFLEFTDTEPLKIVKHCATRWLSLEKCVGRLLHHWEALTSYFESHDDRDKHNSRVQRVADWLTNPEMKMYYMFLQFILAPLNEFNRHFQADESMIGYLHAEMTRLLRLFLAKFVSTPVIRAASDITTVNFRAAENQLGDNHLAVGMKTRTYLADNADLPTEKINSFFQHVRVFYVEVTDKLIKKFPFKDETLKTLSFVDPEKRDNVQAEDVVQLAVRFGFDNADSIAEEFQDYQLTPMSELPKYDVSETRFDTFWLTMEKAQLPSKKLRFSLLSKVALAALTLPHSNADAERSFSLLRKIQQDSRGNLAHDTTTSLMSWRMNEDEECHNFKPSSSLLRMTKSACTAYKKEHSKKD